MRRIKPRKLDTPFAVWSDGVHLVDTPIWCDARRRRDICFASAFDRVAPRGHGQLIATRETLALLDVSGEQLAGSLTVPLRRVFSLGTLRLELFPTDSGLGAAGLRVEHQGRNVVYAGAVQPHAGLGDGADVRRCDAVVVDAPFGEAKHKFAPPQDTITQLHTWVAQRVKKQQTAVVFVDNYARGLDVAYALRDVASLSAHRAIITLAKRLSSLSGVPPLHVPRAISAKRASVVLWPLAKRQSLPLTKLMAPVATAWVSGDAIDRSLVRAVAVDKAFAWSHAAGREPLLAWIAATHAKQVFVTGRCAVEVAAAVGAHATVLGPPVQLPLFVT